VHAINHTCHSDFENCKFLHTGITKDPLGGGEEDEGGVGGRRTSVVFVQATRRVERDEEFFANYCNDADPCCRRAHCGAGHDGDLGHTREQAALY
jgi:hypothetical protein